ncbi:MAG: hypothetical protein GAK34_02775 [Delftia tsuruhatensis]|nr:MAG: hypothetical protein GAK34_02775 [Delftia tsuruhatensis]
MIFGHYRYSDVFQIKESEKASSITSGHYIDIEYNETYANVIQKKVDPQNEDAVFHEARMRERAHLDLLKELIALLSIVTNQSYDLDYMKELIVRPDDQEIIPSFSDMSSSREIPRDSSLLRLKQRPHNSWVSIDPLCDDYFKNYFKLDAEARERYNASIFLYQSMRKILLTSASMAFIGLISAIENLMDFESKKIGQKPIQCTNCNQPIYSISKRFKEFMIKFSEFDVENTNSVLNKFYSQRSSISHTGGIFEIDRLLSRFSMNDTRIFSDIEFHVRIALFNYLLNYDFGNNAPDK